MDNLFTSTSSPMENGVVRVAFWWMANRWGSLTPLRRGSRASEPADGRSHLPMSIPPWLLTCTATASERVRTGAPAGGPSRVTPPARATTTRGSRLLQRHRRDVSLQTVVPAGIQEGLACFQHLRLVKPVDGIVTACWPP